MVVAASEPLRLICLTTRPGREQPVHFVLGPIRTQERSTNAAAGEWRQSSSSALRFIADIDCVAFY